MMIAAIPCFIPATAKVLSQRIPLSLMTIFNNIGVLDGYGDNIKRFILLIASLNCLAIV